MFLRCGDYLKFLMGLPKISTKMCAQSYVSSLWRLTWVFDGTWKNFHKKSVHSPTFLRCGEYLKFLRGLGKFRQKDVPSYTFFSLWRLTWIFEGTWKNFHKKVCPVICFFAVETNLSFWWHLDKFSQKSVPSHAFLRCGDYLKCLRGLGKFRQKDVTSYTFFSQCRLTWVFEWTWKVSTKRCDQLHIFFTVQTILSFGWDLEKFRQKGVPSYTFFFAVQTILNFWWVLESFDKKVGPVTHFFRSAD